MSYLQHFGLKHDPLGKNIRNVVHSNQEKSLTQQLSWLLQTKGVGANVATHRATANSGVLWS
jgi:hypothetical protein